MERKLITVLKQQQDINAAGFDWKGAANRLHRIIVKRDPWEGAWRHFDTLAAQGLRSRSTRPYYYRGNYGPPPSFEELTAWLWTPQTATAFSLLLLALTVVGCCYFSHKIGEVICTAIMGFAAIILFVVVFLIFISQWID
jgi:hypothetical protein